MPKIKRSSFKTSPSVVLRPTSPPPWRCWNSPKSWLSRIPLLSSPKVSPPMFKPKVCQIFGSKSYLVFDGQALGVIVPNLKVLAAFSKNILDDVKQIVILRLNILASLSITCIQTLGLTTLRPIFALSQPELTTAQPDFNQPDCQKTGILPKAG